MVRPKGFEPLTFCIFDVSGTVLESPLLCCPPTDSVKFQSGRGRPNPRESANVCGGKVETTTLLLRVGWGIPGFTGNGRPVPLFDGFAAGFDALP